LSAFYFFGVNFCRTAARDTDCRVGLMSDARQSGCGYIENGTVKQRYGLKAAYCAAHIRKSFILFYITFSLLTVNVDILHIGLYNYLKRSELT